MSPPLVPAHLTESDVTISGQVEVVVDPNDIRTNATLGEVVAHEVLGEAFGRLKGVAPTAFHKLGLEAEKERRRRSKTQRGPELKR